MWGETEKKKRVFLFTLLCLLSKLRSVELGLDPIGTIRYDQLKCKYFLIFIKLNNQNM